VTFIRMGNVLLFSSNNGVMLKEGALEVSAEELQSAVRTAFSHLQDWPLLDACCGSRGPLAHRGEWSYEEYLEELRKYELEMSALEAKKRHTKSRRAIFKSIRDGLILKMIDAGVPYVCATSDCGIHQDLTVDHIIPLSRGGTDELSNLQFLCVAHNSSKGDRLLN
jgi:5-methylcytosine-specific restriction endonuclease McrA